MEELLANVEEFLDSAEDNLKKSRFNAAVSDFFKAIVILCDYLIYKEMKITPKNHKERFLLLEKYFNEIYATVSKLFKMYTQSYTVRLAKKDADEVRTYAYELKNLVVNKEQIKKTAKG